MPDDVELLQFPYSHYNEKARWALDWKDVPHRTRNLMPGLHFETVRKLTGQTATPVVGFAGRYIAGSAAIIDELERRYPTPPLYPADPAQRQAALDIQRRFDAEVGPQVRTATLSTILPAPGYLAAMFADGQSLPKRVMYRCMMPVAAGKIRAGNGITGPDAVERAIVATAAAFDFVAINAGPSGYLVGEGFSVADLTAASLLAVCCDPPYPSMARAKPMPPTLEAWIGRWKDHPGAIWVLEMYRRHRAPQAAAQAA